MLAGKKIAPFKNCVFPKSFIKNKPAIAAEILFHNVLVFIALPPVQPRSPESCSLDLKCYSAFQAAEEKEEVLFARSGDVSIKIENLNCKAHGTQMQKQQKINVLVRKNQFMNLTLCIQPKRVNNFCKEGTSFSFFFAEVIKDLL